MMEHVIAAAGLRLRYICDPCSIERLDTQAILSDLSEPETHYAVRGWFARIALTDFDHVVLATDCETGRHVAMLVASDGDMAQGRYLDLRAAFVISAVRGSKLMRRMLAYTLSRISCLGDMPRILAARTSIPACYRLLSLFSQSVPGAAIFPDPKTDVIDLIRAGLARNIARHTAPHLEYEARTGALKGARIAIPTCFATTTGADGIVDTMFRTSLGSSDQMMVIVDMRSCDEAAFDIEMRALIRSRWKIPFLAMQKTTGPTSPRTDRQKPTLSA